MENNNCKKKYISVTLTQQDHDRLSQLAAASSRTLPGYLRWLLHRHFREQDHP